MKSIKLPLGLILPILLSSCSNHYVSLNINNESLSKISNYIRSYYESFVGDVRMNFYSYSKSDISEDVAIKLMPNFKRFGIESIPSFIRNYDPIEKINKIEINYSSDHDFYLYYGKDVTLENKQIVSSSNTQKQEIFEFSNDENISFFKFECGDSEVVINSINVVGAEIGNYVDMSEPIDSYDKLDLSEYINYSPINGESITIPCKYHKENGQYLVDETKTYTYYSFDYIKENYIEESIDLNTVAYTDPVDVSNYYTLFNKIPVNYTPSKDFANSPSNFKETGSNQEVQNLFGDKLRYVSYYCKDYGYTKNIPNYPEGDDLNYYEFDIDLDLEVPYSFEERGIGRIIGFSKGFTCYDDNVNVCVYTDDHYFTFMEYLNNGTFAQRFDTMNRPFVVTNKNYTKQNYLKINLL